MLCVAIYSVDSDNFDTLQRESQIVVFDFNGICSIIEVLPKTFRHFLGAGFPLIFFFSRMTECPKKTWLTIGLENVLLKMIWFREIVLFVTCITEENTV